MHDHHRCVCEHERVRFCRACRTVYCEDCKQEWVSRPLYSWPYIQYSGYSLSGIASNLHVSAQTPRALTSTAVCGHATGGAAGDQ
jgi:hypothetical protein